MFAPKRFMLGLLLSAPLLMGGVTHAATLQLDEALRRTRAGNPALRAAGHDVAAARARERDARRAPSPALTGALENFGGDLGGDRSEAVATLGQTIELGGDRPARGDLAAAVTAVAAAERDVFSLELEAVTVERFCEAWLLQERLVRLREAARFAAVAAAAAAERLRSGAAPAHEEARARAFLAMREIERDRTERDLATARRRLALQWSDDAVEFDLLVLAPVGAPVVPPWDSLAASVARHPQTRRGEAERQREHEQLRLAHAQRVPDVTLGAGVRRLAEVPGAGFLVTLSLPLPIRGPGQGAIGAALATRSATEARTSAARARALAELRAAHERLSTALASNREVRSRVLPAAQEALRTLTASFRSGRFSYLEIQEGQRGLLEAQTLDLETTAEVWRARLELERWIGAPLVELSPGQQEIR